MVSEDVYMKTVPDPDSKTLFVELGLGFFVELSFEEVLERVPELLEFSVNRLNQQRIELRNLTEFKDKVETSLQSLNQLVSKE